MLMTRIPVVLVASLFLLLLVQSAEAQSISNYIVVDQFGYTPAAVKIAVIRDPVTGYDGAESFIPGETYAVIDENGVQVYIGTPDAWAAGAEDASSGDKAWRFNFSSVQEAGKYYILDIENNVRSHSFNIGEAVYNEVLKHAVRTFFYQRAGFEKSEPHADAGWADGASHIGPLQDKNARLFSNPNNAATEKDLHGGWYDAGDYNKYTNWTASYIIQMMKAYLEKPDAWGDNYNIPESGNGIPDLLDEAKWGLDFLLRMQQEDGSVLSIVDLSHASPPSSAMGQSLYGSPNTSSAQNSAAAYAIGSKVYRLMGMTNYADTLIKRAEKAWDWSEANPAVIFRNNDAAYGSSGIGAGQQEEDDYNRSMGRLQAACYLFDVTGNVKYRDYFDAHYTESHLFQWSYAYPFEADKQEILLYYTTITNATATVKSVILSKYNTAMNSTDNFSAYHNNTDPYRAYIKDYTWGSNSTKCSQGNMFYDIVSYNVDATKNNDATAAAAGYLQYIHGVNPLNLVYLSNMYKYGGNNCVNEFYHTWFYDNHSKWDRVGESEFGPAPGFLSGGPNPSYDWDGCCPSGCGSAQNNAVCISESINPPTGQPDQKSYKDFNTSWPLNSWAVTENSCGYQINYIRLLSKYVNIAYDCNNELNGTAYFDNCGICVGGSTGLTNSSECTVSGTKDKSAMEVVYLYPNPTKGYFNIANLPDGAFDVTVSDITGSLVKKLTLQKGQKAIELTDLPQGTYILKVSDGSSVAVKQLTKM